jgi:hypothetical protein
MRMWATATCLKKCTVRRWGWGPSLCQNREVDGWRRAATPQPGLLVLTVQEASDEISFSPRGGSGSPFVEGAPSIEIC